MTDRSVDDPPSRSALSTGGGEVTATVVVIDGGENAVAQADSIVEATIVMANPGLNRMDLTRGAETSDIVRRIHIFSEQCSGFDVRWVLGPDDAADRTSGRAGYGQRERGHDLLRRAWLAFRRQPPVPNGEIAADALTLVCVQDFWSRSGFTPAATS